MGYSLNRIEGFGAPFQVVHEQTVLMPARGHHPVSNHARKILFVLSGECRHRVVGWDGPCGDVRLCPGDILALPHRCEQRYCGLTPGVASRLHVVRLSFDPALLPPLPLRTAAGGEQQQEAPAAAAEAAGDDAAAALAGRCLRAVCHLRAGQDARLRETLTHLREEARTRPPGCSLHVHSLCVSLLVQFARRALPEERRTPPPALGAPGGGDDAAASYHAAQIKDYLRHHLGAPPRLGEVARHVRLSEEHTARLFKKATGLTVLEYARNLRVAEAQRLLVTTDRNLSEIARATGFASLSVFSRNFRQTVGVTPSEFKRQIARQMG